eukprot:7873391-Pyramimonas_sp.AAC.1
MPEGRSVHGRRDEVDGDINHPILPQRDRVVIQRPIAPVHLRSSQSSQTTRLELTGKLYLPKR